MSYINPGGRGAGGRAATSVPTWVRSSKGVVPRACGGSNPEDARPQMRGRSRRFLTSVPALSGGTFPLASSGRSGLRVRRPPEGRALICADVLSGPGARFTRETRAGRQCVVSPDGRGRAVGPIGRDLLRGLGSRDVHHRGHPGPGRQGERPPDRLDRPLGQGFDVPPRREPRTGGTPQGEAPSVEPRAGRTGRPEGG